MRFLVWLCVCARACVCVCVGRGEPTRMAVEKGELRKLVLLYPEAVCLGFLERRLVRAGQAAFRSAFPMPPTPVAV